MSPDSPASDPAHGKGRRQASWLVILALAPLLPIISFFSQEKSTPEPPPPQPTPAPVVEPEPPYVVSMRATPFPVPVLKKHYEPIGDTGFDDDHTDDNPADQPPPDRPNASTFYRNAFLRYAALTDEDKKLLRQPVRAMPAKRASELFKTIAPIMDLLHKGGNVGACQWGATEQTYDKPLPHVTRALDLGVLAVWSADYRFAREPEEAVRDLDAQAKLSSSLGDTLGGWLMQMRLQTMAIRMLRQHTGDLNRNAVELAVNFLENSEVPRNISRAFEGELQSFETLARNLSSGSREEQTKAMEIMQAMVKSQTGGKLDRALEVKMLDSAWLLPEWRYTRSLVETMSQEMSMDPVEYDQWWENVQKTQLGKDHPLAAVMLTGLHGVRKQWSEYALEHAMIGVGLSLMKDRAAYSTLRTSDPSTGWEYSFSHVKKTGGFELRSKLKVAGQPLVLSFTRPR